MLIENGAWVLVADGEKYVLLKNQGDADLMDLRVIRHEEVENPPNRDQGADRPGRREDGAGPGRSAMEETDWNRLEKERFAADVAEQLRHAALGDEFKSLVIVADPRTLGALRASMHKGVAERVVGEIDKNLTGMSVDKIERALESA